MLCLEMSKQNLTCLALFFKKKRNLAQLLCAQKQGLAPYGPSLLSQIYWWFRAQSKTNSSITFFFFTVRLNTQMPRPCTAIWHCQLGKYGCKAHPTAWLTYLPTPQSLSYLYSQKHFGFGIVPYLGTCETVASHATHSFLYAKPYCWASCTIHIQFGNDPRLCAPPFQFPRHL